jgi:histidyl-tRNA synthetase
LDAAEIAYTVNPTIVRGLDYYTRTVFEFVSNDLGAQSTVCGGGRYDGLVSEMTDKSKELPALGFAMGIERLMMILEAQKIELPDEQKCEIYIASMGDAAQTAAFKLMNELQKCSIVAECDLCARSLKAQMKYADKIGASYTLVLGDDELQSGKAVLKNMRTGEKNDIRIDDNFINDYITICTQSEDLSF